MKRNNIEGLAFILLILSISGCNDSQKEKDMRFYRDSISFCWKNVDMAQSDDETREYLAASCKEMEVDFKTLYNVDP